MYFIWYIIIGILAGFIASKIMKGGGRYPYQFIDWHCWRSLRWFGIRSIRPPQGF